MPSSNIIFWEVDTQADFMLPGGKLYVPGAERLLPNIRKLTDAARQGRVFLVSHGCFHIKDDPEFKMFPPHCIKGSPPLPCRVISSNISRFSSKSKRSTFLKAATPGNSLSDWEMTRNSLSSAW
jgi:hypothetical protein